MKVLLGIILIAHGLLHAAIWTPPPSDEAPMRTAHSWLLGEIRPLALALAGVAAVVLVAAGVGYLAGTAWWPVVLLAGAGVSALLMALTFTPWWLAGLAIDAALIVWAMRSV